MSLTDPIADMLIRINNGLMAHHAEVKMPSSKVKAALAKVLVEEGYITGFEQTPDSKQGILSLKLKYSGNQRVIDGLKRVSKPSRRVYVPYDQIPKVMSGLGINILSTNRGIMSDRNARRLKLGGEILCAVW
jgi:small subunit ribosomal protein S8